MPPDSPPSLMNENDPATGSDNDGPDDDFGFRGLRALRCGELEGVVAALAKGMGRLAELSKTVSPGP